MTREAPRLPISIIDFMDDPHLAGPFFTGGTWTAWRVVLKAAFGIQMTDDELTIFQAHTGRQSPPRERVNHATLVVGRRGGKSRILALIAVYLAIHEWRPVLAKGETGSILVIASDRKQARVIFHSIKAMFGQIRMLQNFVKRETADVLELNNGVSIEIMTGSIGAVRGYTVIAALCDEQAFWSAGDNTAATTQDIEVINSVKPAMATVPGSMLLSASSPYARRGQLWADYRRMFGQELPNAFCWQAPTQAINPAISLDFISEEYGRDPASAAAEFGGLFRTDVESFISQEIIDGVTAIGRVMLPFSSGFSYRGFCDPSGGVSDSMTMAIAHEERDVAVLDLLIERRAPFNPDEVVKEFAEILSRYQLSSVTGDKYSGEWVSSRFQEHGIKYEFSELTKSQIYCEFLPVANARRCELLDHKRALSQFMGLERRTGRGSNRDSVDHSPGAKDDAANSVAGAIVMVAGNNGLSTWKKLADQNWQPFEFWWH